MNRSPRTHWLLALAFLLGQTLALVHATAHELVPGSSGASCATCAVAHSPGAAAHAVAATEVPQVPEDAPVARVIEPFATPASLHPPSRGPPTFLA